MTPDKHRQQRHDEHDGRLARYEKKAAAILGRGYPSVRQLRRLATVMADGGWEAGIAEGEKSATAIDLPDFTPAIPRASVRATADFAGDSYAEMVAEIRRLIEEGEKLRLAKKRKERYRRTKAEKATHEVGVQRARRTVNSIRDELKGGEGLTGRQLGDLRRRVVRALADVDWAAAQRAETEVAEESARVGGLLVVATLDGETTTQCQFWHGHVRPASDVPSGETFPAHFNCRSAYAPVSASTRVDWFRKATHSIGEPKRSAKRKRRYSVAPADVLFPGASDPPWKTLREGIRRGRRNEARVRQPRSEKERMRQWLRQEARRNKRLLQLLLDAGVFD